MSVPRPGDTYSSSDGKIFTVIGIESKEDGFYTHYRDDNYEVYNCRKEAFIDRFTLLDNYDSRSRNNGLGKQNP